MSKEEANQTETQVPSVPSKTALDHLVDSLSENAPGLVATAILGTGVLATALGLAGAVLAKSIQSTTEKRIEATQNTIVDAINTIRRRLGEIDALLKTEHFASLVMKVADASMRTRLDDRRAMLRNVLVNSATAPNPSEFKMNLFIRLIEELEPIHLVALAFCESPVSWMRKNRSPLQPEPLHDGRGPAYNVLGSVFSHAFPDVTKEVKDIVISDLESRNLLQPQWNQPLRDHSSFTTNLGKEFLRLVSD